RPQYSSTNEHEYTRMVPKRLHRCGEPRRIRVHSCSFVVPPFLPAAPGLSEARPICFVSAPSRSERSLADLAVFYEHPQWFEPLFAALDRHGLDWTPIRIQDHTFDPADPAPPAPVILNRLAMSSFLRQEEHALFYSIAVLGHWESLGARVINGP